MSRRSLLQQRLSAGVYGLPLHPPDGGEAATSDPRARLQGRCRRLVDFPFLNFGNTPFATADFVTVNCLTMQVEFQLCDGENAKRQFQWFTPLNDDVYMRVSQLVKRPGNSD